MKKALFATIITSVALVGCVEDEALNPQTNKQKVTFATPALYSANDARANVYGPMGNDTDHTKYPTTEDFVVYAVSYEDAFNGWANGTDADFSGKAVSYDDEVTGWAPKNGDKYFYWENCKKMAFAAYSPADLEQANWGSTNNCSYGSTGLTITNFEVASDRTKQFDLMFSTRTCDHEATPSTANEDGYKGIPILFQHALSSIRFAIKNESTEETVALKSIKIMDVNYKGTFNENITEDGTKYDRDDNVSPEWNTTTDVTTYTAFENASGLLFTNESVILDGTMILMPQDLSDDAQLEIIYTVDGKERTKYVPLNVLESTTKGTISNWVMGTRYTYCLHYQAQGKIFFAPSIDKWIDIDDIIINL